VIHPTPPATRNRRRRPILPMTGRRTPVYLRIWLHDTNVGGARQFSLLSFLSRRPERRIGVADSGVIQDDHCTQNIQFWSCWHRDSEPASLPRSGFISLQHGLVPRSASPRVLRRVPGQRGHHPGRGRGTFGLCGKGPSPLFPLARSEQPPLAHITAQSWCVPSRQADGRRHKIREQHRPQHSRPFGNRIKARP